LLVQVAVLIHFATNRVTPVTAALVPGKAIQVHFAFTAVTVTEPAFSIRLLAVFAAIITAPAQHVVTILPAVTAVLRVACVTETVNCAVKT
jgi:hypothetical protein